ncbi:hypothetical protein HCU74_15325 [Spongiibacter sp. KMU-166]|uniref:Alginate export domain-containing protein n=1 Tax=Spongiibacter thalassae TaxID=2721624 RepID=A0ABX1GHT4_9GAMM|nr:hypothetical protein [Spongiibacter thalassae]NKI18782.1 hypothetical protein [Spongiibacter thalassae]
MRLITRIMVGGLGVLAGIAAYADESQEPATVPGQHPNFLLRTFDSAEKTRDDWSARWVSFAEQVDRYFSKEDAPADYTNESYLKLQIRQSFLEEGGVESDVRLRAKFDLPNTKRKAKLFFSSDDESDRSLENRVRTGSSGERVRKDDSLTGLEFAPDSEWHRWKRSARVGIKFRAPLVPFAKVRMRRPFEKWGEWTPEFQQEFWWFRDKGWGETSEFQLGRPVGTAFHLRYVTVLEFEDQNDFFENVHVLSLQHGLSSRESLEYRVGAFATNEFDTRLTAYFTGMSYSKRVYEDWVFLTVSPELFFARDQGWDADASLTFRFDVFFSN